MKSLSSTPSLLLFLYCMFVFLAALAGGWFILALKLTHTRLQMAVSSVAGLMLGIALLHFIPHALEQSRSPGQTMQWVLAGFLLMFFLQRVFHYHHHHSVEDGAECHKATCEQSGHSISAPGSSINHASNLSWIGTTIGLSLHSVVDGVALATAVCVGISGYTIFTSLGVALAVILHKPFGAMAISTLMTAEGCSRSLRHLVILLFALVTPLGALVFFFGLGSFSGGSDLLLSHALALCAGTFLCIACADLLPELQFHSHDRFKLTASLIAGLILALLLGHFGHPDHEHHHDTQAPPGESHP